MVCEAKEGVGFYRPRQAQETPFYKLACPPKPWRRRVAEEVCAEVAHRQFVFTIPSGGMKQIEGGMKRGVRIRVGESLRTA